MSKSPTTTELPRIDPGKILHDALADEGISINGRAEALRANRISLIVNRKRGIRADTAARLARFSEPPHNIGLIFKTATISK